MAEEFDVVVPCAICHAPASTARLTRDGRRWRFEYWGIEAGGFPLPITEAEAERLTHAFREPVSWPAVAGATLADNASFCPECEVAYCASHWTIGVRSWATCPHGHGHGLDPHWSPAWDDD